MYLDIELAENLLNQLWSYLNPLGSDTISKATVFDFLLLLIFNVGHQSEKKLASMVAQFLQTHYHLLDINLQAYA